ncbi:MAG: urocanate hydratase [Bacteroidota bacterium]|nr:urocanate hydratase [Bacteroidota bacterium]
MSFKEQIRMGIPEELPDMPIWDNNIPHAPKRNISSVLSIEEKKLAIRNALRYFKAEWHTILSAEFAQELQEHGRIYMYRFLPTYEIKAKSIEEYPYRSIQAAAIMLMIQNNLDPLVAKYPHELITYGGNGAVFQNWAQYLLTMQYLANMHDDQTLVLYSGHPLGLFPSQALAPRVVITNGMMIPNYSKKEDWNKYNALGVTQYGQMTAGSFMYIGPQGIVHGTTITLLNAAKKLSPPAENLHGKLFITSGLGGMSGAQSLAAVISGLTCVIAEVDPAAIQQRLNDGYIQQKNVYTNLDILFQKVIEYNDLFNGICFVYAGNIVEVWEYAVQKNIPIDLGSDQTSLHNIDDLGYCPIGYSFTEAEELMNSDKTKFMIEVRNTLIRHVNALNILSKKGMYFWDYGNAFLKEAGDAGADIWKDINTQEYKYPSYVQDIMGPLYFDYGFGPFRWVCMSGNPEDLQETDQIAASILKELILKTSGNTRSQYLDNLNWIENASKNLPVVGSLSRILYADSNGRIEIAAAFNRAIQSKKLKGPMVIGRDHHDVSGTDSPFRETSNIYDGSKFTADMAIHNVIGDSFRGATWVSIHNGGGVGWGEVINGGFGMVLDGSESSEQNLRNMLFWDVNNGIARRAWARNEGALESIKIAMRQNPSLQVTLPNTVQGELLEKLF